MPFTPFHLGLPLFVHSIFQIKQKNSGRHHLITWFSIFFGSIAPDIQGAYSIFIDRSIPLHGFSHTIVGAFFYAIAYLVLLTIIDRVYKIDNNKIIQSVLFFTAIVLFHLIPDMFIYPDMHILWPIADITFGDIDRYRSVARLLSIFGITGAVMGTINYIIRFSSS